MAAKKANRVDGEQGTAPVGLDAVAPAMPDGAPGEGTGEDASPEHGGGEGEGGPTLRQGDVGGGATSDAGRVEAPEPWDGPMGATPVRGITLIDPDSLARQVGPDPFPADPGDGPEPTSREDEDRLAFLRRYAGPRRLFRPCLVADDGTIARLKALRAEAPNAGRMIEVVERAALTSRHAGSTLSVPPVLAVGPPGTGKTTIARKIADALGQALTVIDGGATKDQGPFVGHDVGYRGSGPGHIARALLDGRTASPVVLLDEVDKVSGYNHGVQPLDALLALLEPGTARAFVDNYIGLPLRADHVIWLLTANAIERLPPPLLDRVVVVDVQPLGRAGTRAVVRRISAELLASHGLPAAEIGDGALDLLEKTGLRAARRILSLAIGPALAAGRAAPDAADIAGAAALLDRPVPRRPRPDKAPAADRRAPVGFVHFARSSAPEGGGSREVARPRHRG